MHERALEGRRDLSGEYCFHLCKQFFSAQKRKDSIVLRRRGSIIVTAGANSLLLHVMLSKQIYKWNELIQQMVSEHLNAHLANVDMQREQIIS